MHTFPVALFLGFRCENATHKSLNSRSISMVACTVFAMVSLQRICPNLSSEWSFDEQKGSNGHSNKIGRALERRGIALGRVDPGAVGCSKRLLREVNMSLYYLFAYCAGVSHSLRVWRSSQGSGSTNEMGQLPSHHFRRKSSLAVMQPSS